MVESIKIIIAPEGTETGMLSIEDAMHQTLDIITLLTRSDETNKFGTPPIIWKLASASTNSPLCLVAEAYSNDPHYIPTTQAVNAKNKLVNALRNVFEDDQVPVWIDEDRGIETLIRNILNRNLKSIGKTDIIVSNDIAPVVISPTTANHGLLVLDRRALERKAAQDGFIHVAHGSLEGEIVQADTYYNKPSFLVRDRVSGKEIRCIIKEKVVQKLGSNHHLDEVWQNKRVLVEGQLSYDKCGQITKVEVDDMAVIKGSKVILDSLFDPDFTNGLTPSDYLARLREGDIE